MGEYFGTTRGLNEYAYEMAGRDEIEEFIREEKDDFIEKYFLYHAKLVIEGDTICMSMGQTFDEVARFYIVEGESTFYDWLDYKRSRAIPGDKPVKEAV
jgi:hypothetical protein